MTRLRVAVRKRLEGVQLDVDLSVGAEIVVLFGPSGAGKTSVLNLIAGLLEPDDGEIEIGGRIVFRRTAGSARLSAPPRDRRVGYVFQSYALFPHMTALENVAYPLRRRADRRQRALDLLAGLGMEPLAHRHPDQLSGGQQQRVALARALALDSSVLLLDEPFAALDGALCERLQQDLRRLQRERSLAVVVVTHDIDDAFAVGDRLAVMRDGRIEQVGPVAAVLRQPASGDVADVLGVRNLIRARVIANSPVLTLDWEGERIELEHADPARAVGSAVTAYIRPEDVKVIYPDRPIAASVSRNVLPVTIVGAREGAGHRVLQVRTRNGGMLELRFPRLSYASLPLVPGAPISIALRSAGVLILSG